jgi:two-component system LytT family response regulator
MANEPTSAPETLRAIIVDDEAPGRDALNLALAGQGSVAVVATCSTGAKAVAAISRERPDVVFLDVQMPEMDGFDVIAKLTEVLSPEPLPVLVFVTAHDRFALKAFDVFAADYLLKPWTRDRLAKTLARVRQVVQLRRQSSEVSGAEPEHAVARADGATGGAPGAYATRLMVKKEERITFVLVDSIEYLRADGSHVVLHSGKDHHALRRTMRDLEAQLDPKRFVRIHRGTIVNVDFIKEIQPWFNGDYVVILRSGEQLRLSRGYRERLLRPQL